MTKKGRSVVLAICLCVVAFWGGRHSARSSSGGLGLGLGSHNKNNNNNNKNNNINNINKKNFWKQIVKTETGAAVDSSTGTLFQGEVVRKYPGNRLRWPSDDDDSDNNNHNKANHNNNKANVTCDKWSVVTTIFAPTDSVRRAAALPSDWCIVIVADTKTPSDYLEQAKFDNANAKHRIHFLSVQDQEAWGTQTAMTTIGDFVRAIPYRHFARKNIGYLYAIYHGAQFLFDFDDDNILLTTDGTDNENDKVLLPIHNEKEVPQARIPVLAQLAFNHHPLMGASLGNQSWARGFPLDRILDVSTHGDVPLQMPAWPMDRVGVLQYCANSNPDIDAIHRLAKPLPMNFDATARPVVVPARSYAPYNAQATVHTAASLWATLLPATVPGRVSDIWRGYFAQRLFHDVDLSLVFLPPAIRQDRNEHSYLADMKAELDLYFKSAKLLEFLDDWQPPEAAGVSIPARMEALWIDLYERQYIEADDVKLLQLWLKALVECGYKFPRIKRNRYHNVMVMGQFDQEVQSNRDIIYWQQKWKEAFRHVQVRGSFPDNQLEALNKAGVEAYGSDDEGETSHNNKGNNETAMSNLGTALEQQVSIPGVDGVMYIQDNVIGNVNVLARRGHARKSSKFPSDSILAHQMMGRESFADVKVHTKEAAFRVHSNGKFSLTDGKQIDAPTLDQVKCSSTLREMALDPNSKSFLEDDGSLIAPREEPSDFLFVPTKYAVRFKAIADLMVQHGVDVDCGFPAIVQMLRHLESDLKVELVNLCTSVNQTRGLSITIEQCAASPNSYGVYRPIEMDQSGLETWTVMFDRLTFG